MTAPDLIADLRRLAGAPTLPDATRDPARHLLARLSAPVSVAVLGPDAAARSALRDALAAAIDPAAPIAWHSGAAPGVSREFDGIDIAIWVTDGFTPAQAAAWAPAPDALKDHSFLALAAPCDAALAAAHADDFARCLSVAAGDVAALAQALHHTVIRGREADTDHALAFLAAHAADLPDLPAAAADPAPAVPPAAAPAAPAPLVTAAARLDACATALAGLDLADTAPASRVIDLCAAAADDLTGILADAPPADRALQDAAFAAADSLVLMTLEGGLPSAVDAVTTLLQLQKDLKLRLAA